MKYPKYPAYKDSGVEWIGEIPATWSIKRLKYIIEKFIGGGTPSTGVSDYWTTEGGFSWVAISDITKTDSIMETERKITVSGLNSKNLTLHPPGTIVYSMYASVGKVSKLLITAATNQAILGLVNRENQVLNDYLKLSLEAFEPFVGLLFSSNTQNNINEEKVKNIIIPLTHIADQASIIRFLSTKNVLTDNLISKTQKMIGLLKEKRQAIITKAVTKGLDPNVPMKDSGVEWIGEIPEHWKLSRIKFVSEVTMGQSPSSDFYLDNGNLPFLQGCAEFGEIFPNPKHYCEVATKTSRPGDILLSVRAPVGEINLSDRVYGIGRGLCSIRPLTSKGDYLKWYLFAAKNKLISISNGSTYDAVAIGDVKNLEIPISMVEFEQNAICEYLNIETTKIELIISKHLKLIDLLKEYRTSLITQAVTGKIDVRGFTHPATSSDT